MKTKGHLLGDALCFLGDGFYCNKDGVTAPASQGKKLRRRSRKKGKSIRSLDLAIRVTTRSTSLLGRTQPPFS